MRLAPRRHDIDGVEVVIKDAHRFRLIVGFRVKAKVAAPLHGHAFDALRSHTVGLLADEGGAPAPRRDHGKRDELDVGDALNVGREAIEPDELLHLIGGCLDWLLIGDGRDRALPVERANLAVHGDEGMGAGGNGVAPGPHSRARERIALIPHGKAGG